MADIYKNANAIHLYKWQRGNNTLQRMLKQQTLSWVNILQHKMREKGGCLLHGTIHSHWGAIRSKTHSPEMKNEVKWGQAYLGSFVNLVIDEHVQMTTSGQQNKIWMVDMQETSIIMWEAWDSAHINSGSAEESYPFQRACLTMISNLVKYSWYKTFAK